MADVTIKVTADNSDAMRKLKETDEEAKDIGKGADGGGIGDRLSGAFDKVKTAAKAAAAAGVAAAAAIGKQALDAYANYQQLNDGAKLMFADGYDYIAQKAQDAYKTVGMSQNDYLTQVNGLATGLKTALGGSGEAAAELADKVVTAEADVIAATGETQENVQNAFNGVMKGNYTMLDNLHMGINPTKEGFQEVIDKVNEWNAAQGNATNYQMGNYADMESALVDYVKMMGFAGQSATEATGTVSGSIDTMKAAWQNWLTGLGDPSADMGKLTSDLVTSIQNVAANVGPVIGQMGESIKTVLNDALGGTGIDLTPLFDGISQAVQNFIPYIQQAGDILSTVFSNPETQQGIQTLISFLGQLAAAAGNVAGSALVALVFIFGTVVDVIATVVNAISGFVTWLMSAGDSAGQFVSTVGAFFSSLPGMIAGFLANVISGVVSWVASMASKARSAGSGFVSGVAGFISGLPGTIAGFLASALSGVVSWVASMASKARSAASQFVGNVGSGLASLPGRIASAFGSALGTIGSFASSAASQALGVGRGIVDGIVSGIAGAAGRITSSLQSIASQALGAAKAALGIGSPSKVFRDQVGRWIPAGAAEGVEEYQGTFQRAIDTVFSPDIADRDYGRIAPTQTVEVGGDGAGRLIAALPGIISASVPDALRIDKREFGRLVRGVA